MSEFAASLLEHARPQIGEFNLGDSISLQEAEAVAMVFNAGLRTARLRAGVTAAGATNAGLWEDPTIGVDITRIIESVQNPWKLAATIGLTLPVSGRLGIEKDRASREHAADLARIVEREWRTRIALREAWTHTTLLAAQLESTRALLDRVAQVLSIVDTLERAGEIPRIEATLFRVERATRLNDVRRLEAELTESELTIKQLMGLSPTAVTNLSRAAPGLPATEPGDADRLHETNPSLAVALAEYATAEQALRLEIRKQYPDITIGPGYGRDDGNNEVLLGISLPLPILNANRRAIAEADAARELARAEAEALLEHVTSELARADLQLRTATAQRHALETEILPLVDDQYSQTQEIARRGELNSLLLLETLSRQYETKLRLIDAVRSESLAAIRRQELIGPPPPPATPRTDKPPETHTATEGAQP